MILLLESLGAISAFLFGACIGSFLNVCISRWPAEQSIVSPRSRCPGCGHRIRWFENVPLVSWLVLKGRCTGCSAPISAQYPLVELAVGLGWLAAFVAFDSLFTALRVAVFGTVMLGVAVTDAKHYLIPDGFTVFGLLWCLTTAAAAFMIGDVSAFAPIDAAIIGACAGAGAIAIVGWLGEVAMKKEAMGFGDVTLMAVVGAALGPWRALLTVFVGATLAAVVFIAVVYPVVWLRRGRARPRGNVAVDDSSGELPLVPFGVFLAPAAVLTLLWGSTFIDWYRYTVLSP